MIRVILHSLNRTRNSIPSFSPPELQKKKKTKWTNSYLVYTKGYFSVFIFFFRL